MKINNALYLYQAQAPAQAQSCKQSRLQTLDKDTVSFKANEPLFLLKLQRYLKEKTQPEFILELMESAKTVDPKNTEIVDALKEIKENPEISENTKKTLDKFVFNQFGKKQDNYLQIWKERFAL
jgi:hypothetical protein